MRKHTVADRVESMKTQAYNPKARTIHSSVPNCFDFRDPGIFLQPKKIVDAIPSIFYMMLEASMISIATNS